MKKIAKLTIDSPYHFGWKVKDEREGMVIVSDGTHQEIDLDSHETDITIYKDEKAVYWLKKIGGLGRNE